MLFHVQLVEDLSHLIGVVNDPKAFSFYVFALFLVGIQAVWVNRLKLSNSLFLDILSRC